MKERCLVVTLVSRVIVQLRIQDRVSEYERESQTISCSPVKASISRHTLSGVLFFIKHGRPLLIAGCDFNGFRALHKVHGVIGN